VAEGRDHSEAEEGRVPTREEFLEAQKRELARHNLRLSVLMGRDVLTPEDRELLTGDTPAAEVRDLETVRRWSASRSASRGVDQRR
jgi:hypothetical protein